MGSNPEFRPELESKPEFKPEVRIYWGHGLGLDLRF